MGTTIVNGIEVGPDGKTEWAKIEAGYAHVESPKVQNAKVDGACIWYGHAVREAFVAGAEWQENRVFDIHAESFKQILEAAEQSKWIPPEYMMNDWLSDVCDFLRNGPTTNPKPVKLNTKVSKTQELVLFAYADYERLELAPTMGTIAINLQMEQSDVRVAIRALARKGLAKLYRGLSNEDSGPIHGSGYGLTPPGMDLARKLGWKEDV